MYTSVTLKYEFFYQSVNGILREDATGILGENAVCTYKITFIIKI